MVHVALLTSALHRELRPCFIGRRRARANPPTHPRNALPFYHPARLAGHRLYVWPHKQQATAGSAAAEPLKSPLSSSQPQHEQSRSRTNKRSLSVAAQNCTVPASPISSDQPLSLPFSGGVIPGTFVHVTFLALFFFFLPSLSRRRFMVTVSPVSR